MKKRIIVWSAQPDRIGSIVEAGRGVELAESRSEIATLPVDERMLSLGPIHGYFRRDWGLPGIAFRDMKPLKDAPMLMWVTPDLPYVHFAARIIADEKKRPRGILRLSPFPSATGAFTGGIGAVGMHDLNLDELNIPGQTIEEGTGWILRGRVGLSVQVDGYLACCLNGVADGVRVLWTAVTQSSEER